MRRTQCAINLMFLRLVAALSWLQTYPSLLNSGICLDDSVIRRPSDSFLIKDKAILKTNLNLCSLSLSCTRNNIVMMAASPEIRRLVSPAHLISSIVSLAVVVVICSAIARATCSA